MNENDNSKLLRVLNLDIDEPFYFESDSLALRNNTDYSSLLKTLTLLQGQRIKACQDLESLIDLKEEALKDPLKFINSIQTSTTKNIPTRQKVYVLPDIDFNKYYDCVDLDEFEAIKTQNMQRTHSLRQTCKIIEQQQQQQQDTSSEMNRRTSSRTNKQSSNNKQEKEIKNYNKPWTVDEQRQLEECLLLYPPEDNEAARFRKIADKLGTRTPLQVQSHCQKYFIKLAKAGLPIPGRMPNLKTYVTKKGVRGKCRSTLVRGACLAARGGGRGIISSGGGGTNISGNSNSGNNLNRSGKMVGRGVSLNEISSMWTSFNPPITMNDDDDGENLTDYDDQDEQEYTEENSQDYMFEDDEGDEEIEEDNYDENSTSSSNNIFNLNKNKL